MLLADILHSCADSGIAAAAVASIGGSFATRIRAEAARRGVSVGTFTASLVSRFAAEAGERDWRELTLAIAGADHPVLSGLQLMAERMLNAREQAVRRAPVRDPLPIAHVPSSAAAVCCTL